jgi:hypothetical protein
MGRNFYNWPAIVADLRRTPGHWVPLFPDHPARLVSSIRLRRHPALRFEDGYLEATIVNKYQSPGFAPRGDIWVRYVSTPLQHKKE